MAIEKKLETKKELCLKTIEDITQELKVKQKQKLDYEENIKLKNTRIIMHFLKTILVNPKLGIVHSKPGNPLCERFEPASAGLHVILVVK